MRNEMLTKLKKLISEQVSNGKAKGNGKYIALQCALVLVALSLILALYELLGGIIVASLGASSFILFVTPHTNSSKSINLIGGYICGSLSGVSFGLLHRVFNMFDYESMHLALIIGCASAAAVAMLLMVLAGVPHPPAAALAIGLAADSHSPRMALAALIGVTILCAVRYLLRKQVKNLI
jgi:CBS-domain-containing membrane protein